MSVKKSAKDLVSGDIRLLVLDFDNCMTDTLRVWENCLSQGLHYIHDHRAIEMAALEDMVREAPGQYRFNDFPKLLDWMNENYPVMQKTIRGNEAIIDAAAKSLWLSETASMTSFYPTVLDTLHDVKKAGAQIVIQTDCEDVPFMRRLYLCADHAVKAGQLNQANDIFNYIDHAYCQPGIVYDDPVLKSLPASFVEKAQSSMTVWQDKQFKPSHKHMDMIMQNAGVTGAETLYLGDTHKDGCEAKAVVPQAQFGWCLYGARVADDILQFYSRVGSRSYSYGEQTILAQFREKAIVADMVLDQSMGQIREKYTFSAPQPQAARPEDRPERNVIDLNKSRKPL